MHKIRIIICAAFEGHTIFVWWMRNTGQNGINPNVYMHAAYIFSGGLNKTYIMAVSDNAAVTIESGCTWTLNGNCTISSLANNCTINFNGYTITLTDSTVLS